jgi:hypothetical protein
VAVVTLDPVIAAIAWPSDRVHWIQTRSTSDSHPRVCPLRYSAIWRAARAGPLPPSDITKWAIITGTPVSVDRGAPLQAVACGNEDPIIP